MKVVYVVEVDVPDEFLSSIQTAAHAVMDSVRTKTNLPCHAWVTIEETAQAVLAVVSP